MSDKPLLFPGKVPIIGQPEARLGPWFITLTVLCPCTLTVLLVGQPGSRAACGCGKVYEMRGMPTLSAAGALQVPLGVGQRTGQ